MSTISSKLDATFSAAMIGNIVASAVTNKPTFLHISLGVMVCEKSAIELLFDVGVTTSYDEVLQFGDSSAAPSNTWDSLKMEDLYMELSRIIFIICSCTVLKQV